jgi:hypothetical protein
VAMMPTTRKERPAAIGIVSPVCQFVTVVPIDGGSAGVGSPRAPSEEGASCQAR